MKGSKAMLRGGKITIISDNHLSFILEVCRLWQMKLLLGISFAVLCILSASDVQEFCRPIVILADRQKEEMDEELRAALKGFTLEWHTRTGFPHSISDLQKVAAGQAKNVILLNPDSEAEEVHLCPNGASHC